MNDFNVNLEKTLDYINNIKVKEPVEPTKTEKATMAVWNFFIVPAG